MTNHCAVTCPIVTEAVEAASEESRLRMAQVAMESEKISENEVCRRFKLNRQTFRNYLARVGAAKISSTDTLKEFTRSDGRLVREITPEERDRWFEAHQAGKSFKAIADEFNRDRSAVSKEIRKRQEPERPAEPPEPKAETPQGQSTVEAPPAAPSRLPKRPAHLKATLERETPYIKDRLLVAAQLLVEAHTIVKSESKRLRDKFTKDNLVWTTHFQEVVEFWNEAEIFGDFDALFEVDTIKTYDDALRAISQIAKRTGERVQGIRISTGCAPDPNKAHMVISKA